MGLFGGSARTDINAGIEEYKNTADAILVDVRERKEFQGGHIPGAINLPLSEIRKAEDVLEDYEAPIFVYCQSGARSSKAAAALKGMDYENVKDIGGIQKYKGSLER